MKLIVSLVATLFLDSASAALINVSNINDGVGDTVVTDPSGLAITHVWTVLFLLDRGVDVFPATPEQLITLSPSPIVGRTSSGANELFSIPQSESAFYNFYDGAGGNGQAILIAFSDNPDWSLATSVGLVDTGDTLDPDGFTPDSDAYVLERGSGTVLIGEFVDTPLVAVDWTFVTGDFNTGPQFRLTAAPEPSSFVLLSIAGLCLLSQRRARDSGSH